MQPSVLPLTLISALAEFVSENAALIAPVIALSVAWILYIGLGTHVLGADDDYWPALRYLLLTILHHAGKEHGLYATLVQDETQFVAVIQMDEEAFEEELEAAGYLRNPLSAYKTTTEGYPEVGSWARRYNRVRHIGEDLREDARDDGVPVIWVFEWLLGTVFKNIGDVIALTQTHVILYRGSKPDHLLVFAHTEPNSLNPLTAWQHYAGGGAEAKPGIEEVSNLLRHREIPHSVIYPEPHPGPATALTNADGADGDGG